MVDCFVVKAIVIWVHIIVNKYVPIKLHKNMCPYLYILHIDMYPYLCYDMGTETDNKQKSNQEVITMSMTKKELETKVQEFRNLKAMKEELENELKAVEYSIIEYMKENELDTEITDTAKITYKPQKRTTLDKEKLTEILGEDLKPFEKTTSYNVLRVK